MQNIEKKINDLQINETDKKQNEEFQQPDLIQNKQSLQQRFQEFKKRKQEEYKYNKYLRMQQKKTRKSEEFKDNLRMKFIETAKKYYGVPYAKRFYKEDEEMYNAPLFLDCCALIRQIVYDLREDFGFVLDKWNQSYQFDTLPVKLEEKQLRPGDLIFYSADYYNNKIKDFPHKMVHVEIYVGPGEQTIGSRWQRGLIQEFNSYKFTSSIYHNIEYHYRSLDTWLDGVCKSWCQTHEWLRGGDWEYTKHSIFNTQDLAIQTQHSPLLKQAYVGTGNNHTIAKQHLLNKQYSLITQPFCNNYYFKWVQLVNEIDFFSFHKGHQIVNHISNVLQVYCHKQHLLKTVVDFLHNHPGLNIHLHTLMPPSYRLDNMSDAISFINNKYNEQQVFIMKPYAANQGQGLQIIHDVSTFKQDYINSKTFKLGAYSATYLFHQIQQEDNTIQKYKDINQQSILQQYIHNPLLLNKSKFDLRLYVIIINCEPLLVLYKDGYVRMSVKEYSNDYNDKYIHFTNQSIQMTHQDFKAKKDQLIINIAHFKQLLQDQLGYSPCSIHSLFHSIKSILSLVMQAGYMLLDKKQGCFEIFGCDLIIDQQLNPYLLEVNSNPAFFIKSTDQKDIITSLVQDTIDMAIHFNQNQNQLEEIMKDIGAYYNEYEVLYNETTNYIYDYSCLATK